MSSVDLALLGLKYLSLWFERAMGTRNAILYFLITFLRADYGPTFTQRNHHADALTQLWTVLRKADFPPQQTGAATLVPGEACRRKPEACSGLMILH